LWCFVTVGAERQYEGLRPSFRRRGQRNGQSEFLRLGDRYTQFLADLKSRIQTAQLRASLAVNRELVLLYWQIGRDILDRQERESWGARVIDPSGG
jgi:hypothetical protein